jgi:RHS repeat-associated protein
MAVNPCSEYELSNHLGNVLAVVTDNIHLDQDSTWANVGNTTDYYPFGLAMDGRTEQDSVYRYGFNGKEEDFNGEWGSKSHYDYGFRIYNPSIGKFLSVDPLAHEREWLSPYNFVQNNPISRVDPTGALDAPMYDENANFLGTDDEGLQGKAIVMNKDNFKQGMSHEDALGKSVGVEGLKGDGATTKLLDRYNGLKDRYDYDGYLTLDEANKWYREGNGQPLFTSLSKIDLSGILSLGENYVGDEGSYNLLLNSNSVNDGLVY